MAPPPVLHIRPLVVVVLLLLLLSISLSFAPLAAVPECMFHSCGRGNITHPFWHRDGVNSSKNSYCGYPFMDLICKKGFPTLQTPFINYTVEIDMKKKNVSLVANDSEDSKCPWVRESPKFESLHKGLPKYTPDTSNLTLFFHCERNLSTIPILSISCPTEDRKNITYVVRDWVETEKAHAKNLSISCEKRVSVPVDKDWVVKDWVDKDWMDKQRKDEFWKFLIVGFSKVLEVGLEFLWNAPHKYCTECDVPYGACREKNAGNVCRCSNYDPKKGSCHGGGSKKKIVIGVCIPASFVVCVAVAFWYWRKHKNHTRRKLSGEFPLVRSISSDQWGMSMDTQYQSSNHLAHIFTYKELEDATNGFHPSNEIGDGGFGTVYKGEIRDGRTVAVKLLYGNNYKRMEQFMNEILILSRLRHPNLVTLYGCTSRQCRELLLVYEFVANGTVADHLHGSRADDKSLSWPVRMRIAMETASALAYLHASEPQIVHRDVKTHNILLDKDFHVKVADFGLSRLFPTTDVSHVSTAPQGTPGYVDPEYHQCYQLTDKSDVYSFGVVLAELISSKPAVDITRSRSEINLSGMATSKIRDGLLHELADPELRFESDPDVTRMIRSVAELAFLCLQGEKDLRPCMEEVKNELMKTAGGGGVDGEVYIDVEKSPKDDAYLLHFSGPYSPDTVTAQWKSRSTTPNTSA